MKVLFMTNIPAPYRVDFFNELGKYVELTVTYEGRMATDRNAKWCSLKSRNYESIFLTGIRTKSDQFFCTDIIKVIKRKYDHIIVGGYSTPTSMLAIEYMRIHKIPFLIEADGGLISDERKIKYKIKRHFISSASGWFSSGKSTTKYLSYYGADRNRIYEYPFSSLMCNDIVTIPLTDGEKQILREKLKISGHRVVVSVGQSIPRKGFDILLKAWKDCQMKAEIYIIGAVLTEEYSNIMEKLSLKNVHFVDFKTKDELKEYYKAADLFVLPTREDIWGLVINEAMAQGLPVITTERCVAGLELIKDGENGYIVPIEDEISISNAINRIVDDEKLRWKMSKRSLEKIQPYTIENMARIQFEILKNFNVQSKEGM